MLILIKFIAIITLSLQLAWFTSPQRFDISSSVTQVQQLATYTFRITLSNVNVPIPAESSIFIAFPDNYETLPATPYVCQTTALWTSVTTISCNLQNRVLKVTGGFPNTLNQASMTLQFRMVNIQNPIFSGQTKTFDYKFYDSGGSLLALPGMTGKATLVIVAGTLTMQMSVSPKNTNANSVLTVKVISQYKIPKAGYLNLRFETFWLSSGTTNKMVITSSVSCSPFEGVSASISCTLGTGTLTAFNLIIRNLFDDDHTGDFAFQINEFLNPPTTAPQGAFDLTSFNSWIERRTIASVTGQQLTGVEMSLIEPTSAKVGLTLNEISSETEVTIECYINNRIQQSDTVWIQFPSEVRFSNPVSVIANNFLATNVNIGLANMLSFNNLILVSPGIVLFFIDNVTLPDYVYTFRGFSIRTERSSFGMEYINDPFGITTTNGPMTVEMSASNYQIGMVTDYQLEIALTHAISTDGALTIEFGILEYFFTPQILSTMSCESNRRLDCALSYVNSNTLRISNVFVENTRNVQVTIKKIVNILQLGSITSLVVTSYKLIDGNEYSVDKSTQGDISVSLVARRMFRNQFQVTSSSSKTFEVCEMGVLVKNSNPVPSGAYLEITFPPQIGIGSSIACTNADLECTMIAESNPIRVMVVLFGAYAMNELPQIKFERVRNPMSTAATSSFGVSIFNVNDQLIEYRLVESGGVTYTASESRQLSLRIERNSQQNSFSPVVYSFIIGTPFEVINGVVSMLVPNEIQCISSCVKTPFSSSHYSIVYQGVSTASNSLTVVSNFKNHFSFQPLSISFKYLSPNQFYEYGKGSTTVTNTHESTLGVSVAWTNRYLAGVGSLTVNNLRYVGRYTGDLLISINFPAGFDLLSVNSQHLTSKSNRQVVLQTTSASSLITTYLVSGIVYPSVNQAYPVEIIVKTSSGHSISKSNNIQWVLSCEIPCKQCPSSSRFSCNSCYSDASLVDGHVLWHPSDKKCLEECGNTYYTNLIDNTCYQCSSNCQNCLNFDQCTTCKPNWYLVKDLSTCFQSVCPRGYFISNQQCISCTPALNCRTCSDADSCSSCTGLYFYHQATCTLTCPPSITTQNTFTNNCDSCPANCLTCEKSPENTVRCLTCQIGYYLGQGGCYESCSTVQMVPDLNGFVCVNCAVQCLTCRDSKDYCLRCDTSSSHKYFHMNDCLQACPSGFYGEYGSSIFYCQRCTAPCQQCLNSSATSCTRCKPGHSLNGNICESVCPPTLYSHNGLCLPCTNDCKTCQTENICFTCVDQTSLYVDECSNECPIGYVSIQNVCTRCSDNCKTCSSVNYCTGCKNISYLHQGQCLDRCPVKFFINQIRQACVSCPYECKQCVNSSYCSSCENLYSLLLSDNSCINTCESGFIPYQGVCRRCDTGCTTCIQTPIKCTRCEGGYYFVPSQLKCVTKCFQPLRHYQQNMSCLSTCIQPSYEQYRSQTLGTVTSQFIHCILCPQHCLQCTSNTFCTQCVQSALKVRNLCQLQCPTEIPYPVNGTCRTCNIVGCFECNGIGCKQCNSPLLLIEDSMCISGCSSTQAYNSITRKCDVVISSNISGNSVSSETVQGVDLRFIPFPYMIVAILVLAFILVLNFSSKVLVVPMAISSFGVFVMLCAYTSLIVYLMTKPNLIIQINSKQLILIVVLVLGVGLMMVLNMFISCKYMIQVYQPNKKWTKLSSSIIVLFGSLVNLSLYQLFNSKLYGFVSINNSQTLVFWQSYAKITKLTVVSYVCFIISGIVLTFSLSKDEYLYYSFIELVILAIIEIGFIVVGMIWPIDYTVSETQSYDINDSFNKLEDLSIDQKQQNHSEVSSTTTIHARTQFPHHHSSIKAKKDDYNLTKTKSEFLFTHNRSLSSVEMLPGQQIVQGIEKGLFRQEYQQAMKRQQQEKQLSLLSSASKFIKHKTSQQKNTTENDQIEEHKNTELNHKEVNIFDIENNAQDEGGDDNHVQSQIQQTASKKVQSPSHSSSRLSNKINQNVLIEKPQSPQKSRKRSKQTIRVKSIKSSSQQSQLQIKQNPDPPQSPDQPNEQNLNKNSFHEEAIQDNLKSESEPSIVNEEQELTEKQPYYYRNPNIIFEAIDQDVQAEQNETKVSLKHQEEISSANKDPQDIQEIDIYKYPTNKTLKSTFNNNLNSMTLNQTNQQPQDLQKPIINHLKDTEVSVVSSQTSKSSEKPSIKPNQKPLKSQQPQKNQKKKLFNKQTSSNKYQNGLKQQTKIQKEQILVNIFEPKDDLQFDEPKPQLIQQPQKWNPSKKVKKQIIHADLQSIYTVSDRADSDDAQDNYRQNLPIIKKPYQTVNTSLSSYRNVSPSLDARNSTLVEDIEDFDEDNDKPSSIFQPPVKNLLSNLYDQMPGGIKSQKKEKKLSNTLKKNKKK